MPITSLARPDHTEGEVARRSNTKLVKQLGSDFTDATPRI